MGIKILHITENDSAGGATRAAQRLHHGLTELGHSSRLLVGRKAYDDAEVRPLKRTLAWRLVDRACAEVFDRLSLQYVFYPSSFGVALDPWFRDSDVLQLHNTHGNYFSHSALPLLSRRKPVVWTLHDMWPLTGHVAYSYDCERWRFGCGSCPYLDEFPKLERDRTALLWRIKRAAYRASRLTLVAPSRWLVDAARSSPLLGRFAVHHVPYGIDLDLYSPGPQPDARARLGLPPDREVVLFVGTYTADPRKGFHLLEAAVRGLDRPPLVAVAGSGSLTAGIETLSLGEITDDATMADAYRAADLVALPTLADNLPNVALESMACGTPCVAFDVGGVGEAVRHMETGYLVPGRDVAGFARGLRVLLDDEGVRRRLSAIGREVASNEYGEERQARRYAELYAEVLEAA